MEESYSASQYRINELHFARTAETADTGWVMVEGAHVGNVDVAGAACRLKIAARLTAKIRNPRNRPAQAEFRKNSSKEV